MSDMKAETVADIIFRAWIKRYGCPIEIHSDQGRQYESDVLRRCTNYHIYQAMRS
jgi:transposase InsO family protein